MSFWSAQLRVTIPNELRDQLEVKARKMGLTMSAYVRNLIIEDLKEKSVIKVSNFIQGPNRKPWQY